MHTQIQHTLQDCFSFTIKSILMQGIFIHQLLLQHSHCFNSLLPKGAVKVTHQSNSSCEEPTYLLENHDRLSVSGENMNSDFAIGLYNFLNLILLLIFCANFGLHLYEKGDRSHLQFLQQQWSWLNMFCAITNQVWWVLCCVKQLIKNLSEGCEI